MPEQLPDYHQRAFAHNYHAPFIYHVLLKKSEEAPCFGTVAGDARIPPGRRGAAYIKETVLGGIVAKTVFHLPSFLPIIQVYQYVVMPDHVHILMRVKEWSEYHLDYYIEWLKGRICENYSRITDKAIAPEDIFTRGYCDKPLLLGRSLEALFRYIRENPHRLAVRQQFPEFFRRIRKLQIGEEEFEAYGNLFLFRNPDKEAVKISRKFTPQEKEQKKTHWLTAAEKGAVLVSPFISGDEKVIREEAEAKGGKFILIVHEAFPERFKPSAHDFALCEQGRLLIISLGLPTKTGLTRAHCERMNSLAALLASHPQTN